MEQEALPDSRVKTFIDETPVGCPKCGKTFKNEIGLRMHHLRKHSGRGWNTSSNFRGKQKTKADQLREKRDYNRKLRARYYAEGKNSRGELMPLGWQPRSVRGWSPERRAKFNSTWRSKNIQKGKKTLKKFEPIVYPDPRQKDNEEQVVVTPTLKYCPHCGEHVAGWRFAP